MSQVAPRGTSLKADPPSGPRRRFAPLLLAMALAMLAWIAIALSGAVLGHWLA